MLASGDGPKELPAGGASLTSSTPDALWSAPALRVLRPAAVICTDLRRGRELDGCSLSVPAGARLLIHSDPAETGSTLMRVLAALAHVERGEVRIAGSDDPTGDGWGRRVAYLGPNPGLHTWMSPIEALRLASALVGLSPVEVTERVQRVLDWVRIPSSEAGVTMSRGGTVLQQRTGFAAALVGDPEVLLLDEPLRALDPEERSRLLTLPEGRRTILLASRSPSTEIGIVGHVAFVRGGRVAYIAPVRAFQRAGLELSHRGILELAQRRAAERGARSTTGAGTPT